ncbi:glycosyltransferase family 4 protein [Paludibacterium paludis]|uniref:Glycosyl transferase family 1 domain-containing protein n=1 Tax=Paludibacterium paludis TaxID=1225769 RepID=A0A918P2B9_9NEIS|nr:glycosyltransferase family 4 protein [Paludibacterium paludis]GGY15592.1 hypothetical protein GCM10011289_18620 [Paludibacterium paludis]
MKILLSVFACSPEWGSEPGVGWRWALALAGKHDVTVITHAYFKQQIDKVSMPDGQPLPCFRYVDLDVFGLHPHRLLNSRLYYMLWQLKAAWSARRWIGDFDLVHHLTWGTYRFPSFMGLLGKPFINGPLGGGERSPARLWMRLPLRERAFEFARSALIELSRFDPFVWLNMKSSDLIFCKTDETRDALPWFARGKARVATEIGVMPGQQWGAAKDYTGRERFTLFYAGRLIGLKGVHLIIRALAELRHRHGLDVDLSIAGDGPMHSYLVDLAISLGVGDSVKFLGKVPRDALLTLYRDMDLFVFPSFHDSSGNVILESMSAGLPVVCLDLGGPKHFLDDDSGVVVPAKGVSEATVVGRLVEAISELLTSPGTLSALSAGALRRCDAFTWEKQVDAVYDAIAAEGLAATRPSA